MAFKKVTTSRSTSGVAVGLGVKEGSGVEVGPGVYVSVLVARGVADGAGVSVHIGGRVTLTVDDPTSSRALSVVWIVSGAVFCEMLAGILVMNKADNHFPPRRTPRMHITKMMTIPPRTMKVKSVLRGSVLPDGFGL